MYGLTRAKAGFYTDLVWGLAFVVGFHFANAITLSFLIGLFSSN